MQVNLVLKAKTTRIIVKNWSELWLFPNNGSLERFNAAARKGLLRLFNVVFGAEGMGSS